MSFISSEYDQERVRSLYSSGWQSGRDFSQLETYLSKFVTLRYVPAMIELARVKLAVGDAEGSSCLIRMAEEALSDQDFDAWVDLWGAYRQGLGDGSQELKDAKALNLISQLAETGNVPAQEILMMDYLCGTNGVTQDSDKFLFWATRAMEAGSAVAARELKMFRRQE
jgi:TPR repeat protein